MKLNPTNCAFGVILGKFLGCMIVSREIKANYDKFEGSSVPHGRLDAFGRFLSKSTEPILPFYFQNIKG